MKRWKQCFSVLMIVILAFALIAGCSDDKKDEKNNSNPAGPGSSGNVEEWPSSLPAFNYGGTGMSHFDENENFIGATYSNISNPQQAFSDYKSKLEADGWTLDAEWENDITWTASYSKGESGVLVNVNKDGMVATITYVAE